MIIWSGSGLAVLGALLVSLVSMQLGTDYLLGEGYYTAHGWPKLLAFVLAGAITLLAGKHLNRKEARVVIDKATSEEFSLKPNHAFFFINIETWGYIFFAIAVVVLFI
jgi:hypothetical protein